MNIEQILQQSDIQYSSYEVVQGGKDSSVYRVIDLIGKIVALRILPINRLSQFQWEATLIDVVRHWGIPVPEVISVHSAGEYAVMVMEWAEGTTLLQALREHPERAESLGVEFGRVQAFIHQIEVQTPITSSWLTPATDVEKELVRQIKPTGQWLLHMDFHPLNVLTDGEKITAVIDWMNASTGDRRFDVTRTLSILQIDGPTIAEIREPLLSFIKGYQTGYEKVNGPIQLNHLFRSWAGNRMKRDLANHLDVDALKRIEEWMVDWDE